MSLRAYCFAASIFLLSHSAWQILFVHSGSEQAPDQDTVVPPHRSSGDVAGIPQPPLISGSDPTSTWPHGTVRLGAVLAHPADSATNKAKTIGEIKKVGRDPVVVAFNADGEEVYDVVDTSNASLEEPYRSGSEPFLIGDKSSRDSVLEASDDSNFLLAEPSITGVSAQLVVDGVDELGATAWPMVYGINRTGTEPFEVFDPRSGTTVLEAD